MNVNFDPIIRGLKSGIFDWDETDFTLGPNKKYRFLVLLELVQNLHSSAAPAADCQLFSHVQSHLNYYIYMI